MGDKEKIPGKKYVCHCERHGWLTPEEVYGEIVFEDEDEKKKE